MLCKPGKYLKLSSSHNPISLIFTNLKIICITAAKRLKSVTPNLTHHNQARFIRGWHSANTRKLIDMVGYFVINNLDLKSFVLCPSQIWILKLLHRQGKNTILLPKCTSEKNSPRFSLHRGTCQGSPLTLYNLKRTTSSIYVTKWRYQNMNHKIILFADELLLFFKTCRPHSRR